MPLDVQVERVERDRILEIRAQVLGGYGQGRTSFSRDLSSTTRHWAALVDGVVVGCASVMRLRGCALRGMAVVPRYQRQGVGARLLQVVCAEVDAPMWCNSRVQAAPFYVRSGWVEVGPVFDLQDRGAHRRLTWAPDGREGA